MRLKYRSVLTAVTGSFTHNATNIAQFSRFLPGICPWGFHLTLPCVRIGRNSRLCFRKPVSTVSRGGCKLRLARQPTLPPAAMNQTFSHSHCELLAHTAFGGLLPYLNILLLSQSDMLAVKRFLYDGLLGQKQINTFFFY